MSEKSGHPGFDHALSDRVIDEIQARPVTSGAVLAEPHEPLAIFDIQLIRIVIFYESTKIRYFCKEPLAKCASILYGAKGCARHHFRAIKSAVSLKLDVLFAKIECMGDRWFIRTRGLPTARIDHLLYEPCFRNKATIR